MGQLSLEAEINNRDKTLRQMHKHWMKLQSLSCAGINFPWENWKYMHSKATILDNSKLLKKKIQRGKKKEKERATLLKTQNHMYDWK